MERVLAVVGSRSLANNSAAKDGAERLVLRYWGFGLKTGRMVSGGARGPDTWVCQWAKEWGMSLTEFPVTKEMYDKYGKRAPLVRNEEIAKECTDMIAFWDGKSRGTLHALKQAHKLNKCCTLYKWGGSRYDSMEVI